MSLTDKLRPAVLVALAMACSVLAIISPAWLLELRAQARYGYGFVPYDTFGFRSMDPARWAESFESGEPPNPTGEVSALVKAGNLQLAVTQYGLADTNSGTSSGQSRVGAVLDPGGIIGMQAKVTISHADVEACDANPSPIVRARAQIVGGFFNDGSSTGAGDRTGDIIAGIQKVRDTLQGDVIQAFIARCADVSCSATTSIAGGNFVTPWRVGQSHTMSVLWERDKKQFTCTLNAGRRDSESITLSYAEDDATPPVNNFKQLSINNSAANCDGSQKHSSMRAAFDAFMVQRRP